MPGALGAVTNIGMLGLTMPQLQPLLPASAEARLLRCPYLYSYPYP